MVGIGSGILSRENDLWLGDVVVSQPSGQHGGVIQYDRGKPGSGMLNSPPKFLLTALNNLRSDPRLNGNSVPALSDGSDQQISKHEKPLYLPWCSKRPAISTLI